MLKAEISLLEDRVGMLHNSFRIDLTEAVNGNWLADFINKALVEYSKSVPEQVPPEQWKGLHEVLANQLGSGVDADTLTLDVDANLYETYGLDSLDSVALLMAVEEEYGIDIWDHEWEACQSIKDIFRLLERKSTPGAHRRG